MKRKLLVIVIFLTLAFVSSCVYAPYRPPHGVWISEDPSIIIDCTSPEHGNSGLYSHDSVEIEIHARFFGTRPVLEIYDRRIIQERGSMSPDALLMSGTFEIIDDKMYYRLDASSRQRIGVEEIIFHRSDE